MFQLEEGAELAAAVRQAEDNYRIAVNDLLKINLFTNKGEQLIDPNFESFARSGTNMTLQMQQTRNQFTYLVQENGIVKLPVIGEVEIAGLTINEAERKLERLYDSSYVDSFVKLQFQNKRVTVLGQTSQVVPLLNENTSLLEVLALAGGIPFGSKAQNVKIIRGDLQNPEIYVIDLSTISKMRSTVPDIMPGDVIYIEPWRRPWQEGMRDLSPVLGLISSVVTLIFLFSNF